MVCWTADETALKPVDVAPASTVTDAGTCRAALLLFKLTSVALLAAPLK
jgi:hypothetical protein